MAKLLNRKTSDRVVDKDIETGDKENSQQGKANLIIDPFSELVLSFGPLHNPYQRCNGLDGEYEEGVAEIQDNDGCGVVEVESELAFEDAEVEGQGHEEVGIYIAWDLLTIDRNATTSANTSFFLVSYRLR